MQDSFLPTTLEKRGNVDWEGAGVGMGGGGCMGKDL